MSRAVDGVPRALPKYTATTIQHYITRHATAIPHQPLPTSNREAPDKSQVIGIPLFIQRTPPWNRQPWDQPQHPPTRALSSRAAPVADTTRPQPAAGTQRRT